MLVFRHPLAIGRIVGPPMLERIHIEILTIEIDPLFRECFVDMVGQPPERFRVAKIQQNPSKQPLRMVVGEPRLRSNPFRLEP